MLKNTVDLQINLQALLHQQEGAWIAWCPAVDVASQGETQEESLLALQEAVGVWFDDCLERGVLSEALIEAGFYPAAGTTNQQNSIQFQENPATLPAIPQIERPISVNVPAYIAEAMANPNHATR